MLIEGIATVYEDGGKCSECPRVIRAGDQVVAIDGRLVAHRRCMLAKGAARIDECITRSPKLPSFWRRIFGIKKAKQTERRVRTVSQTPKLRELSRLWNTEVRHIPAHMLPSMDAMSFCQTMDAQENDVMFLENIQDDMSAFAEPNGLLVRFYNGKWHIVDNNYLPASAECPFARL